MQLLVLIASIGEGCQIGAHTVLTGNVSLGADCQIGAHNVLSNLVCGEGVKTDAHCVIGKRGFGFDGQGEDQQVLPHLGQVIIGRGCDIGAVLQLTEARWMTPSLVIMS